MRVPVHIAILATVLAIFSPKGFLEFQERVTKPRGIPAASDDESVNVVFRGFWIAVLIVLTSAVFGWLCGVALAYFIGPATPAGVAALQVAGASILLLATLYLRGSAIETYKRQTLIERVDRWIYCAGYFAGTAAIVSSLVWA